LGPGRRPWGDGAEAARRARGRAGLVQPPRRIRPEVPRALDAVCRKAMAVRPSERYASALDLAADVEHWLADEPVSAYAEPLPARAARWARRHRPAVAAAVALLATAVLALPLTPALAPPASRNPPTHKATPQ